MEILQKKEQIAAIIFIAVLLTSIFILLTTVTVYAQDETPHGVEPSSGTGLGISGPLPAGEAGETPSVYIDTSAHLSYRPNPVGLNQIFLVNIWTSPALHAS